MGVRGRHLLTGLPTEVQLNSAEVRQAIRAPMEEILRAIADTLEDTPPELAGDIAREGILLAGGGTLLRGLPELVTDRTGNGGDARRVAARPASRSAPARRSNTSTRSRWAAPRHATHASRRRTS